MISKDTFVQALPLAQKLGDKTLAVLQGSPLAAIMDTCSTYGLHVEGRSFDELDMDAGIDYLTGQCNQKDVDGSNQHNGVVSAYVEQASQAVAQSLSFARNVVMPDVKSVLEKVEQVVAGVKAARAEPYAIVQDIPQAIFNNPLLVELVERFSETTARAVGRVELAPMTDEVARSLIATGAAQFDGEVEKALSEYSNYGYGAARDVIEGTTELEGCSSVVALGVHLLAKALFDNPYDGIKIGLSAFNDRISRLIEQSGRMLYQAIESSERRKKLGMLYNGTAMWVGEGRFEIHVNQPVYLEMLEKGLTPEAVIGNEFLGRIYNDSQLVEKTEELTTVYKREMRVRELKSQLEDFNLIRESIEVIVAKEIAERDEQMLPVARESLQALLKTNVSFIREADLKDLRSLTRDLVCKVFYAHTDALTILRMTDDIGAEYPEIDVREAVLLATTKYVAYWVSTQILVS